MGKKAKREARKARRERRRKERQQRESIRTIVMDFTDQAEEEMPGASVDDILTRVIDLIKERFEDRPFVLLAIEIAASLVPLLLAR